MPRAVTSNVADGDRAITSAISPARAAHVLLTRDRWRSRVHCARVLWWINVDTIARIAPTLALGVRIQLGVPWGFLRARPSMPEPQVVP